MTARLTIHDVNFADLTGGAIIGPLELPPADAIREVLIQTSRRYPDHRIFCRPQFNKIGGGRWVPRPAHEREQLCHDMVSVAPGIGVDALSDSVLEPFPPGRLLHFTLSETHIAISFAHILGDTGMASLTPALLRAAGGQGLLPVLDDSSVSFPFARAVLRHFGRDPRRVLDVLREPRPAVTPGSGQLLDVPITYRSCARTASEDVMAGLAAWRRERCPDASMSSVLTAGIRRAFDRAGVKFASPGYRVLVNGRRYLPESAPVAGNFASAIYVEPDDPCSPTEVEAIVRRNLDSGRALATMAVSAMKDFARVHRSGPAAATLSTLTVSNLGRMLPFEELPLAPNAEYRCASLPEGPSGVTVWLAQLGRRCTATATFCPAVVDPAGVADAIQLLTSDPIALLDGN